MRGLRLVVFDCDGVMFDSREANRAYYNDLLAAFGRPPMNEEEVSFVHMHNVTASVDHLFRDARRSELEAVHRHRLTVDYTPYFHHMIMEPGLVAFLRFARERRYHLAISTNRTTTMRPLLEAFDLVSYFDKVVTADDVAAPKPAADALLEILTHFQCSPDESIYIGDSIIDSLHAEAAGVPLIAFKNSELDAPYHVEGFAEIPRLPPFSRKSRRS